MRFTISASCFDISCIRSFTPASICCLIKDVDITNGCLSSHPVWVELVTSRELAEAFGDGEVATVLGCSKVTPWGIVKTVVYVIDYPQLSALGWTWILVYWTHVDYLPGSQIHTPSMIQPQIRKLVLIWSLEVPLSVPNLCWMKMWLAKFLRETYSKINSKRLPKFNH